MKTKTESFSRQRVADCLEAFKAKILKKWELKSVEMVQAAKAQSLLALRDSLPEFMDQLVLTLRCEHPEDQAAANAEVAREHGEDRAKQPEYTLEEVIFEYHILRAVIIESLEETTSPDSKSQKIIHEFIDRGIGKAAATFAELELSYRKNQSKDFEEAKNEAVRSNQAKSAFLANMSHEIRTPLGAIMGFVGLLKDKGLSPEEISDYHAIIDRNSHHLLRIIDDILDLAKVEAGKVVIENIEFSLLEFLAEFSSLAGIKAREKGISFEFIPETLLPELVISDPTRIRQILSNIVGNAIKFTEKGSVDFLVRYSDHQLEFEVRDTGRGISAEQRSSLFQAFSQADSSTTRKFGGTGLGLVLTKKLSQAFGGDFILRQSEIGKGSVFQANITVRVPAKAKLVPLLKEPSESISVVAFDPYQADLNGMNILLVEDSPDNQYLIQKMLVKNGVKIVIVNDGSEGVRFALANNYDLILMDIQMPIMDGHEAVRTLRQQGYSKPVVALTAHAMKEEREHAANSGFSHFLTKPIDRKSLIDLLKILHHSNPIETKPDRLSSH